MHPCRFRFWERSLALTVTILFTFNTLSYGNFSVSAASPLIHLSIPESFGKIEESRSFVSRPTPEHPYLIHIQDAHGNPAAQRNMARIIRYLVKTQEIDLVFVEGAAGELRRKYLEFLKDPESNLKFVDQLVDLGEITGSELAILDQEIGGKVRFLGLENAELYRENFELFQEIMRSGAEMEHRLDEWKSSLDQRSSRIFDKHLLKIFRHYLNLSRQESHFGQILDDVDRVSQKVFNRNLRDAKEQLEFPNLVRLFLLRDEEKTKIEAAKLQSDLEKIRLMAETVGAGDEIQKFLEHPETSPNPRVDLEKLHGRLSPFGFKLKNSPHFTRWMMNQAFQREIEPELLVRELERLMEEIFERIAHGQAEQKLIQEARDWRFARSLVTLELTRSEWEKARGVTVGEPLRSAAEKAKQFYEKALARDQVFIEKIRTGMRLERKTRAIVITGGFHSEAFKRAFRGDQISYAVIRPKVENPDRRIYLESMTRDAIGADRSQIVKALLGEDPELVSSLMGAGAYQSRMARLHAASLGEAESGEEGASAQDPNQMIESKLLFDTSAKSLGKAGKKGDREPRKPSSAPRPDLTREKISIWDRIKSFIGTYWLHGVVTLMALSLWVPLIKEYLRILGFISGEMNTDFSAYVGGDYYVYRESARAFWTSGVDPYHNSDMLHYLNQNPPDPSLSGLSPLEMDNRLGQFQEGKAHEGARGYIVPPFNFLFFYPLAQWLTHMNGLLIWLVSSLAVYVSVITLYTAKLTRDKTRLIPNILLANLIFIGLFDPIMASIQVAQTDAFYFFPLALSLYLFSFHKGNRYAMATAVGLIAIAVGVKVFPGILIGYFVFKYLAQFYLKVCVKEKGPDSSKQSLFHRIKSSIQFFWHSKTNLFREVFSSPYGRFALFSGLSIVCLFGFTTAITGWDIFKSWLDKLPLMKTEIMPPQASANPSLYTYLLYLTVWFRDITFGARERLMLFQEGISAFVNTTIASVMYVPIMLGTLWIGAKRLAKGLEKDFLPEIAFAMTLIPTLFWTWRYQFNVVMILPFLVIYFYGKNVQNTAVRWKIQLLLLASFLFIQDGILDVLVGVWPSFAGWIYGLPSENQTPGELRPIPFNLFFGYLGSVPLAISGWLLLRYRSQVDEQELSEWMKQVTSDTSSERKTAQDKIERMLPHVPTEQLKGLVAKVLTMQNHSVLIQDKFLLELIRRREFQVLKGLLEDFQIGQIVEKHLLVLEKLHSTKEVSFIRRIMNRPNVRHPQWKALFAGILFFLFWGLALPWWLYKKYQSNSVAQVDAMQREIQQHFQNFFADGPQIQTLLDRLKDPSAPPEEIKELVHDNLFLIINAGDSLQVRVVRILRDRIPRAQDSDREAWEKYERTVAYVWPVFGSPGVDITRLSYLEQVINLLPLDSQERVRSRIIQEMGDFIVREDGLQAGPQADPVKFRSFGEIREYARRRSEQREGRGGRSDGRSLGLNLNQTTLDQLTPVLAGILNEPPESKKVKSLARRIIEKRESLPGGRFSQLEDIRVPGIGPSIFKRFESAVVKGDLILVENVDSNAAPASAGRKKLPELPPDKDYYLVFHRHRFSRDYELPLAVFREVARLAKQRGKRVALKMEDLVSWEIARSELAKLNPGSNLISEEELLEAFREKLIKAGRSLDDGKKLLAANLSKSLIRRLREYSSKDPLDQPRSEGMASLYQFALDYNALFVFEPFSEEAFIATLVSELGHSRLFESFAINDQEGLFHNLERVFQAYVKKQAARDKADGTETERLIKQGFVVVESRGAEHRVNSDLLIPSSISTHSVSAVSARYPFEDLMDELRKGVTPTRDPLLRWLIYDIIQMFDSGKVLDPNEVVALARRIMDRMEGKTPLVSGETRPSSMEAAVKKIMSQLADEVLRDGLKEFRDGVRALMDNTLKQQFEVVIQSQIGKALPVMLREGYVSQEESDQLRGRSLGLDLNRSMTTGADQNITARSLGDTIAVGTEFRNIFDYKALQLWSRELREHIAVAEAQALAVEEPGLQMKDILDYLLGAGISVSDLHLPLIAVAVTAEFARNPENQDALVASLPMGAQIFVATPPAMTQQSKEELVSQLRQKARARNISVTPVLSDKLNEKVENRTGFGLEISGSQDLLSIDSDEFSRIAFDETNLAKRSIDRRILIGLFALLALLPKAERERAYQALRMKREGKRWIVGTRVARLLNILAKRKQAHQILAQAA